jgi:chromosome segregation ATPase
MAKTPENTFGTRIKNAEDTVIILTSFADFKPLVPEDAPAELTKLINDLKTADENEATLLQTYSVSADTRSKLITKDADSLKKSLSPIRAYLQAIYGKEDKQFSNINNILNQIRGFKAEKDKKNADEKTISTSQQSYASLTQTFSDLIVTLQTLNPTYTPTNNSITIEKLKEKQQAIGQANTAVTTSQNALKDARNKRNDLAADLSKRLKRIKKTVQSQYGNASAEYGKLKSYRY